MRVEPRPHSLRVRPLQLPGGEVGIVLWRENDGFFVASSEALLLLGELSRLVLESAAAQSSDQNLASSATPETFN